MLKFLVFISCFAFALAVNVLPPQENDDFPQPGSREEMIELMKSIDWTPQLHKEVCEKLEASGLGHLCKTPGADGEAVADAFIAKNGMPEASSLHPVILVPGIGGSGIEALIEKEDKPAWYCWTHWGSWYQLWVAVYEVIAQPCLLDNLKLTFHPGNNTYSNRAGVETRVIDWGGLNGVNKVDHVDDILGLTKYFATIISALEKIGYQGGKNLFGAPFDWRISTDSLYKYNWNNGAKFQALIEDAYTKGGNKTVYILSHSMGGPTSLYFLNRMSEQWKEKYIAGYIALAAPWSGSVDAIQAIISGSNFGFEILGFSIFNLPEVAKLGRNFGGLVQLSPNSVLYPNDTVIFTPSKNYTARDFNQLFNDIGSPNTTLINNQVSSIINELEPPSVATYCMYGYGIETEVDLYYNDFDGKYDTINQPTKVLANDLGDGTVPLASLTECKNWKQEHSEVNCKEYDVRDHTSVLKDDEVIDDILSIVSTDTPPEWGCSTTVLDAALRGENDLAVKKVMLK